MSFQNRDRLYHEPGPLSQTEFLQLDLPPRIAKKAQPRETLTEQFFVRL